MFGMAPHSRAPQHKNTRREAQRNTHIKTAKAIREETEPTQQEEKQPTQQHTGPKARARNKARATTPPTTTATHKIPGDRSHLAALSVAEIPARQAEMSTPSIAEFLARKAAMAAGGLRSERPSCEGGAGRSGKMDEDTDHPTATNRCYAIQICDLDV